MLPSAAFLATFWIWRTRKKVRAALVDLLFALVLIGVRVIIFVLGKFVNEYFYAHVNYYFTSCVFLRHYMRVYTHPTKAVTAIFTFYPLRTKTEFQN